MKDFFRIPMQFFAEPEGTEPAGTASIQDPAPQGDGQQQNSAASTGKTFTQEELDRVVTERLAREQKKFEAKLKEQEQQFAAKQEEAAQLAKMNADEKKKFAEEKREKDLTAREAAIKTKELRFEALNILNERKLPSQLIDCVNLESAEAAKQSIDSIAEAFEAAITAGVDAMLKSNPPAYSGGNMKTDPFLSGFMEG